MADNVQLNLADTVGSKIATAQLTISGDTADVQMIGCGILSGAEGSWVYSQFVGGAGVVAAGVQRVTLASDDPAVTDLAAIDAVLDNIYLDTTDMSAYLAAIETLIGTTNTTLGTIDADTSKIAAALTAEAADKGNGLLIQGDVGGSLVDLTADADGHLQIDVLSCASHAVTNAGTFAVQVTGDALTALQLIDNAVSGAGFNVTQFAGAAVPIGAGLEATAVRVTLATDSTGVVSIDDNGGAITVDGTVAVSGTVTVDLGANNDVTVTSGTITTITNAVAVTNAGLTELAAAIDTEVQCDIVGALPAGTAILGTTYQSSSHIYDSTTSCEVKHFHAVTSTSDTSIITAVASKRFRVLSLSIIGLSATATNVHLETKTTNTDCFGDSTNPIPIAVDADGDNVSGVVLPWNPGGWFETADANEDMAIILSAAQPVMILGNYIEVT